MTATAEHSSGNVFEAPASGGGREAAPVGPRAEPERGSEAAAEVWNFERVYETHFDFVWRSLRLLGVAPELVEDATQDTFSVVSRQLASFQGRSSLRTWLFAILQRVAANQRRSARRKLRQLEPLTHDAASKEPTAHARAEAAEAIDLIQRFCESLDGDRRALFVLALVEEVPAPEVAEVLGIPINTVYSRVRSLRDGMRRALEQREVEHG